MVVPAQVRQVGRAGLAVRPRRRVVDVGGPAEPSRLDRSVAAPHPAGAVAGRDELALRPRDRIARRRCLEQGAGPRVEQRPTDPRVEAPDDRRDDVGRHETDARDRRPRHPPVAATDPHLGRHVVAHPLLREHTDRVGALASDDPQVLVHHRLVGDALLEEAGHGVLLATADGARRVVHRRERQPRDCRRDDRHPEPHLCSDLAAAQHEVGQAQGSCGADRQLRLLGAPPLARGVDGDLDRRGDLARQDRREPARADRSGLRAHVEPGGPVGVGPGLHEVRLEPRDEASAGLGDLVRLHPDDPDRAGRPATGGEQVRDDRRRRLGRGVTRVPVHHLEGAAPDPTLGDERRQGCEVGRRTRRHRAPSARLGGSDTGRHGHRVGRHVGDRARGQAHVPIAAVRAALLAPAPDLRDEGELQTVDRPADRLGGHERSLELRVVEAGSATQRPVAGRRHRPQRPVEPPVRVRIRVTWTRPRPHLPERPGPHRLHLHDRHVVPLRHRRRAMPHRLADHRQRCGRRECTPG